MTEQEIKETVDKLDQLKVTVRLMHKGMQFRLEGILTVDKHNPYFLIGNGIVVSFTLKDIGKVIQVVDSWFIELAI